MKRLAFILLCVLILLSQTTAYAMEFDTVYDEHLAKSIPIPLCYIHESSVHYLGDEFGPLNNPQDVFVDGEQNIYIADTGNNRIVKLDPDGGFIGIITVPEDKTPLNQPQGVFVTAAGDIYIADTDNHRVVILDKDGNYVKQYEKPESKMLGDDFVFAPRKVSVTSTGNLYVLKQQWLMSISKEGEFRGFVGVTKVSVSFFDILRRIFMNEEQRKLEVNAEPPSCLSFDLTAEDEVYVTTMDTTGGQLKKLNLLGNDIYPRKSVFGEYLLDENNIMVPEIFVDVASDKTGNVFLLDQKFARVCVYDQQGNNLAIIDGSGYGDGELMIPSALTTDAFGRLIIADQKSNKVHIYKPTKFMSDIFMAADAYNRGQYTQAVALWEVVAKTDGNYVLANRAIAKSYYKNADYERAMDYYRLADDKAGYSEAYSKHRHLIYKNNFFLIMGMVALASGAIIFGLFKYKKYSIVLLDNFNR